MVLVAVEIALLCGLIAYRRALLPSAIAGAVGILVLAAVLLLRHGVPLAGRVAHRFRYWCRPRRIVVEAPQYADLHGGVDTIDVPPEVHAFFRGATVWETTTHDGDRLGVVDWNDRCSATVEVRQPGGILHGGAADTLPLARIVETLQERRLELDAVQIVSLTVLGQPAPGQAAAIGAAATELRSGRARARNRNCYVTVRVDPGAAAEAIVARGGGRTGVGRLLATALSTICAAIGETALETRPLDGAAGARVIADSLYHSVTAYDPFIEWRESTRELASSRMAHGSFAVVGLRRGSLSELPTGPVFAYSIGTQVRLCEDGPHRCTSVVRLSCRTPAELVEATRVLRQRARRAGIALRPLEACQHSGLHATVPMGGV
jgi:type VII secretion protein EccE